MRPRATLFDYIMAVIVSTIGVALQLFVMVFFIAWDLVRWVLRKERASERAHDWMRRD